MIEVRDVCFSYGRHDVLKGVSFRAESGECVGILGNNGAGKSTLVTCLNRIRVPSSGTVLLEVKDGPYVPIGPEDILEISPSR